MITRRVPPLREWLVRLWLPGACLLIWWVVSPHVGLFGVPTLSQIVTAIDRVWLFDKFASDLLPSVLLALAALVTSVAVGVTVGFVLGSVPLLDRSFTPIFNFIRTIPKVLLISPLLVVLGVGTQLTFLVLCAGAVWPILLSTVAGVRAIPATLHDLRAVYQVGRWDWIWHVALRSASPQIMAGIRTSVSLAVILLVVAQAVGATSGVGFQLRQANAQFRFDEVWAAMAIFVAIGYAFNVLFTLIERRVLRWDFKQKAATS